MLSWESYRIFWCIFFCFLSKSMVEIAFVLWATASFWFWPLSLGEKDVSILSISVFISARLTWAFRSLVDVVRRPLSWFRMILRILVVKLVFREVFWRSSCYLRRKFAVTAGPSPRPLASMLLRMGPDMMSIWFTMSSSTPMRPMRSFSDNIPAGKSWLGFTWFKYLKFGWLICLLISPWRLDIVSPSFYGKWVEDCGIPTCCCEKLWDRLRSLFLFFLSVLEDFILPPPFAAALAPTRFIWENDPFCVSVVGLYGTRWLGLSLVLLPCESRIAWLISLWFRLGRVSELTTKNSPGFGITTSLYFPWDWQIRIKQDSNKKLLAFWNLQSRCCPSELSCLSSAGKACTFRWPARSGLFFHSGQQHIEIETK